MQVCVTFVHFLIIWCFSLDVPVHYESHTYAFSHPQKVKGFKVAVGNVFGIIVMQEDPATFHPKLSHCCKIALPKKLSMHGLIHPFLNQSSCPLCRKSAPA